MTESDREEQKMKVVKFGGSSMADAGQYRKVRDILLADPERRVVESDVLDQLRAACEALKEPYRSTALLYFVRERSFQEIADDTGQNLKTVQTRVYRAKAQLKKMIRREQVL